MMRLIQKCPYHGYYMVRQPSFTRSFHLSKYLRSNGQVTTRGKGIRKGIYFFLGSVTVASGATVAYASYDPNFRKWLSVNAPITDDILKIFEQTENKSLLDSLSVYFIHIKDWAWSTMFGAEEKPQLKPSVDRFDKKEMKVLEKKEPESLLHSVLPSTKHENPWTNPIHFLTDQLPRRADGFIDDAAKQITEKKEPSKSVTKLEAQDVKPGPLTPLGEQPIKNLIEFERNIEESAKVALSAYQEAASALRDHENEVNRLIESSIENLDSSIWLNLKAKTETKSKAVEVAEQRAKDALHNIENFTSVLASGKISVSDSQLEATKKSVTKLQQQITAAADALELERRKSSVSNKYWNKVEDARKYFLEELETLVPSLKISERQLNINKNDLDLFILHIFQNVLYYQKELHKLETMMDFRLKTVLNSNDSLDKALISAQVDVELEKEKRKLDLEFQKRSLKIHTEAERELRTQLKRQAEAHSDHLKDAVTTREQELVRQFQHRMDELSADEQAKYKIQLASMMGRLRGLETALKARADADKRTAKAQLLWSACQGLHLRLKSGSPGTAWSEKLKPLTPEVSAVKNAAAENDELVATVLDSIPKEAVIRGVYPEDALRERFLKVERVARQLALLPEGGGSLPLYFLSYLQSFLVVNAIHHIPLSELSNEPVEISKLNTYDILLRARYWLDRGNFNQALRYMNLLKGASRSVATDWMKETRILLETQQAANTLMAHASASGLVHL